jgi:hypothetical protein
MSLDEPVKLRIPLESLELLIEGDFASGKGYTARERVENFIGENYLNLDAVGPGFGGSLYESGGVVRITVMTSSDFGDDDRRTPSSKSREYIGRSGGLTVRPVIPGHSCHGLSAPRPTVRPLAPNPFLSAPAASDPFELAPLVLL